MSRRIRRGLDVLIAMGMMLGTAACSSNSGSPVVGSGTPEGGQREAGPAASPDAGPGMDAGGQPEASPAEGGVAHGDSGASDGAGTSMDGGHPADAQTSGDASSAACPRGTTYDDGCPNAPAGTPQMPSLLDSYGANRPPWNVAGVDYAVGIHPGTTLEDPATISMAGVTVDTTNLRVDIQGDGVTLSGYDFSLDGGWAVRIDGSGDTVQDCNFVEGSKTQEPLSVGSDAINATIAYCHIDGKGLVSSFSGYGVIAGNGVGTTTIEYSLIENAYSEDIVIGSLTSSTPVDLVVKYNVIGNAGFGASQGAHGDWIQTYDGQGDVIDGMTIDFNTWIQNVPTSQALGAQGLSLASANIMQGPVDGEEVENNTMVTTYTGSEGYLIIVDTANLNGTATVEDNYIDPTGTAYDWLFVGKYNGGSGGDGPYAGTATVSGNVDMTSGATLTQ